MNQREKIMALILLCILGAGGGMWLFEKYRDSIAKSESDLQAARDTLSNAQMALEQGKFSMKQLENWQKMSLPPSRDIAGSLYRTWLLQKANAAGLKVDDIIPNDRSKASANNFMSIGYNVKAKGSLTAVTKFLYEFYRSAQLHQVTKLNLINSPGAPELTVDLQVEALILPGATDKDSLPDGQSDRLKLANADEYEKKITGRDLFKVYTPPRPPSKTPVAKTPPRTPEFDHATQTKVTGIVGAKAGLEAWIRIFTTGEVLRLHVGDSLEVGDVKGKVESIEPMAITVKTTDDKQLRIPLGRSLRDPDEPVAEAVKPAEAKPVEEAKPTPVVEKAPEAKPTANAEPAAETEKAAEAATEEKTAG